MFAPEDVFKSSPLPRGNYWPSPMVNQHENVMLHPDKSESKEDRDKMNQEKKFSSALIYKKDPKKYLEPICRSNDGKENDRPNLKRTVDFDTASTSVDDLIRDIDKNLSIDPDVIKPTPSCKAQVNNMLSVSDHSDTSVNVLSPSSLNYYMDRFKNSHPTHPSKRHLHTSPLLEAEEITKAGNLPSSNDSSYNTLTLDSSSYLERIVSSDDSTEWSFTNRLSENSTSTDNGKVLDSTNHLVNENFTPTVRDNSPQIQSGSFIEQLTGKTFSELSQLVPKEVINPTDESEDILYQWRLKKHITEAKNSVPILDDACLKAHENMLYNTQNTLPVNKYKNTTCISNVSREIQTDAEKRESSCQADIVSGYSGKRDLSTDLNVNVKLPSLACIQVQDSCSDISISSVSTDDLTNISDLEEEEIPDNDVALTEHTCDLTVAPSEIHQLSVLDKSSRGIETEEKSFSSSEQKCDSSKSELLQSNTLAEHPEADTTELSVLKNQNNVEELLSYLNNIRSNLDDELLNVFIDRYQAILTQMSEIENEINRRCNEE